MKTINKDTYFLSSVGNALKVLDILSVKRTLSLTELTKISGINKSSMFKLLFTLESRNYVLKTADTRYCLGSKFSNYSAIASDRQSLTEMASLPMRQLRNLCCESIYLGILNLSGKVIIIHREDGTTPNRSRARLGFEMDAYTTAQGKVMLAFMESNLQNQYLSNLHIAPKTEKTVDTLPKLIEEIATIKEHCFCASMDELYMGYSDFAAPILNADGKCVASISLVCKSEVFLEKKRAFKNALIKTADLISKNLGY